MRLALYRAGFSMHRGCGPADCNGRAIFKFRTGSHPFQIDGGQQTRQLRFGLLVAVELPQGIGFTCRTHGRKEERVERCTEIIGLQDSGSVAACHPLQLDSGTMFHRGLHLFACGPSAGTVRKGSTPASEVREKMRSAHRRKFAGLSVNPCSARPSTGWEDRGRHTHTASFHPFDLRRKQR